MATVKMETLKNMNNTTAKHATWCVRVLDPRLTEYEFKAKGETVKASRFDCVLVSQDAKQYMLGTVLFEFQDRGGPKEAFERFKDNSVWQVRQPSFDNRSKPEYNGCPLKTVILMRKPSVFTAVPPTSADLLRFPATHVEVAMDITATLNILSKMLKANTFFDFCGKLISVTEPKNVAKSGKQLQVATAVLVDASGGKVEVDVWNKGIQIIKAVPRNEGVALLGCSAKKEDNKVKITLGNDGRALRGGDKVQSLTSLDEKTLDTTLLTAAFVPGQGGLDMDKEAHPTCAVALADAVGCNDDKTFQINRALLEIPTRSEAILTQDGRFYLHTRLRDRTGCVDVEVLSSAVPALYGCVDEQQVTAALDSGTLEPITSRVNARGVLRNDKGTTRKYIGKICDSPMDAKVSATALQMVMGLSEISGDVVIPSPVENLQDAPMLGLAVSSNRRGPIGAHRVILLVEGTCKSKLDGYGEQGKVVQDQTFKVLSPKVRCLLSKAKTHIDLVGYCNFQDTITYRLDKESALVTVSAFTAAAPDAVSAGVGCATIESMKKVSADERTALINSLRIEWETVFDGKEIPTEYIGVSSTNAEYWDQPTQKLKRLESEPVSPKKKARTE